MGERGGMREEGGRKHRRRDCVPELACARAR